MPRLFVYGTLRRPAGGPVEDTHYHHHISHSIELATHGHLEGAELHDFGAYPGVLPGKGTVIGEIFEVSDATLVITDQIEGHPGFYSRRLERVKQRDGAERRAWVYWAPAELRAETSRIASGDWFNRPRGSSALSIEKQLATDRSRLVEHILPRLSLEEHE